nr:thioredoxin family protein [Vibrio fluvialis]
MRHFKVLGSGCTNCQKTAALIEQVAHQLAIEVRVEKSRISPPFCTIR